MGTKQQLLDSLTAHISLYHSREAIQTSNSSTRSAVLRWFSSLSVHQRRAHLTVLDYKFVKILLQMREKLKSYGHGRFIILPDLPQHDSNLPTVCFRKSEGLLARVAESGSAKVEIYRSVELFSSTEGERGREGNEPLCLDAMCLEEGLVKDVNKFVTIMDEITNGEFLGGGEEAKVTEEWVELGWLKAKGYYSLEEFVVNRLEIALVLAWLNSNSGKKRGAKLKEKLSAAGVAANLFWRKKGCLDWWEKLDDSMRKRLYRAYLGKAAPSLTAYMVKHRPFFLDDTNWRLHSSSLSRKGIGTFTGTSSRAKSPASVAEVHGNRNSLYYIFDSLYILQGVSSLLSTAQTDGCDQEKLFFSSLDSVNSISDIILRQLREILLVVSLDCTKLELLGEENTKLDMKKLNEKPVASSRKKKSKNNSKKSNVISRHCFDDSKPDRPTKDKENKIMYTSTEGFKASNYYDNRVPAKDPIGGNNLSANAMEPVKGVTNGKLRGSLRKNRKEMKKRKNSVPHPSEVGDCQSKSTGVSSSFITSEDRPCMSDLASGSSTLANVSKNIVFQSNLDHMGNGHSSEADQSFCLKYHVDTTGNDSLKSELESGSTTIEPVVKCNYSKCKTAIVSRCNAEDYLGKRIKDGDMEGKSSLIHDPASRSFLGVRAINSPAYVSYEWPNIGPIHPLTTTHLPAATDRLHLDVGHNLQTRFHRSFVQNLHVRKSAIEKIYSGIARPLPVKVDWSPAVHGVDRFVPPVLATPASTCNYYSEFIPRRQSSFQNVQCGTTTSEDEKTVSGEVVDFTDGTGTQEIVDERDRHWMSEEESETHAISMMDYNQYFGGGVMYWNPSDYPGNSFSRPPSLCSDDSSWAWREADLTRAVDDMVTFSSSYSGLTSPSAASFCSPFDPLGPGSLGYVLPGSEISSKVLHTSSKMADVGAEESISGSTFKVSSDGEMKTVDTLPYPMLRPIIVPNMSRERSRSEFRHSYDHKSPCVPTNRREQPRIKRPPSPVVLCVPSAPCPPPPSPESDSRKHRGFSTVRSGSSSPRHWGMKGSFHDGDNSEESCMDIAGSEVVWPTWRSKGIPAHQLIQPFSGKLLQDRLVAISQLARDHDHPDITLPLQPPESQNCSAGNIYLPMIHNILHDEIDTFCKKVAAENLIRKRDINWAVKRVARSLQVLWPRSRTNIFGSNATGLALPSSDVDLVVCLPPVRNLEPIKEAGILEGRNGIKETCLQHAARYLGNQEWVKSDSLKVVENTAIPIIMLVVEVPHDTICDSSSIPKPKESADHAGSEDGNPSRASATCSAGTTLHVQSKIRNDIDDGFKPVRLDISFKSPTHSGLQTTGLVKNLTEQFPAVTPLALVLKQFLADRGLYQSYSGGLSSYCLILLITRFLQHEHHHGRPTNQNYGSLLMDFLYFFGNVFDPRQMRISVQGAGVYLNRERGCSIDPLCIDDPLFLTDNVGRNCFRIHQCIKAFGDAYAMMMNELTIISSDNKTYDKSTHKLLPKLIPSLSHLLGS